MMEAAFGFGYAPEIYNAFVKIWPHADVEFLRAGQYATTGGKEPVAGENCQRGVAFY